MKSIKPGRGSSMVEGVTSLIVAGVGAVWTLAAFAMGAGFMAFFGIAFIAVAIVNAISGFYNALAKNRHSIVDIVDSETEPEQPVHRCDEINSDYYPDELDELDETFTGTSVPIRFCPYCGSGVQPDHHFCAQCGKPLN